MGATCRCVPLDREHEVVDKVMFNTPVEIIWADKAGGDPDSMPISVRAVGKGKWNIMPPDGELICLLETMLVPELDVAAVSWWKLRSKTGMVKIGSSNGLECMEMGC